ncbi:FRG domain-containing protein [Oceanobacillus oncorhynchi]|uniref:FRG domain-containing protein n=1 Tax=Oceanobacillus oncorhynchi TaxID=545501 RepID=UPI002116D4F6|nr:FRG domain-containing protein [Oceanobacillus oncorhynchi]UUI41274.1 FRG domain-containing protein [Oceanobacillus oncorhynchi]
MERNIEINSIQDLITALDHFDSDDYYFRGEASLHYSRIMSSAFRPYPLLFSSSEKKYIDYQEILDNYYLEIAHELLEIERDNFLHYSQHHGLPTPLVDITSNPLTALFFSCSSNFEENKSRVHLFQKNKFIDFSLFPKKEEMNLNNFFLDNEFTLQVFRKISDLSEDIKKQLLYECAQNLNPIKVGGKSLTDTKYIGIDPTPTLGYILKAIFQNETSSADDFYNKFTEIFSEHFDYDFKYNQKREKFRNALFIKEGKCFFELHSDKYSSDKLALIIIFLINEQSKNMVDDFQERVMLPDKYAQLEDSYNVVFPPIVMHPSVKFERMKSQEGTFLFQLAHFNGNTRSYIGFSKIKSDITFIINDKKEIFKALNRIGINQKTIFPDHDNIATYLKVKHLMK